MRAVLDEKTRGVHDLRTGGRGAPPAVGEALATDALVILVSPDCGHCKHTYMPAVRRQHAALAAECARLDVACLLFAGSMTTVGELADALGWLWPRDTLSDAPQQVARALQAMARGVPSWALVRNLRAGGTLAVAVHGATMHPNADNIWRQVAGRHGHRMVRVDASHMVLQDVETLRRTVAHARSLLAEDEVAAYVERVTGAAEPPSSSAAPPPTTVVRANANARLLAAARDAHPVSPHHGKRDAAATPVDDRADGGGGHGPRAGAIRDVSLAATTTRGLSLTSMLNRRTTAAAQHSTPSSPPFSGAQR